MRIGPYVAIAVFVFALGGCVDTAQIRARAEAKAQALAQCNQLTTPVAGAKCHSAVEDQFTRPGLRNSDLLDVYQAARLADAVKVEAGTMTNTDADLHLAQVKSQLLSEDQRRQASNAQAAAAMMSTMPVTCNAYGYGYGATTTCY